VGDGEGVERGGGGEGVDVALGGEEEEREVVARQEAEKGGEAVHVWEEGVEEPGGDGGVGGGEAGGEEQRQRLEEGTLRGFGACGDAEARDQGGDRWRRAAVREARRWGRHRQRTVAGSGAV
jgi:hypothetical protein